MVVRTAGADAHFRCRGLLVPYPKTRRPNQAPRQLDKPTALFSQVASASTL